MVSSLSLLSFRRPPPLSTPGGDISYWLCGNSDNDFGGDDNNNDGENHRPMSSIPIGTSSTVMIVQYWISLMSKALCYYVMSDDESINLSSSSLLPSESTMFSSSSTITTASTTADSEQSMDHNVSFSTLSTDIATATTTTTQVHPAATSSVTSTTIEYVLSFISLVLWTIMAAMIVSTILLGYRCHNDDDDRHRRRLQQRRRRHGRRQQHPNHKHNTDYEYDRHYQQRLEYIKSRIQIVHNHLYCTCNDDDNDNTNDQGTGDRCCCICLEPLDTEQRFVCISRNHDCQHMFHWGQISSSRRRTGSCSGSYNNDDDDTTDGEIDIGCMDEWLLYHDHCPICRRDYIRPIPSSSTTTTNIQGIPTTIQKTLQKNHLDRNNKDDGNKHVDLPYVQPLPSVSSPYNVMSSSSSWLSYADSDDGDNDDDDDSDDNDRRLYDDWDALSVFDDLPTWLILVGAM